MGRCIDSQVVYPDPAKALLSPAKDPMRKLLISIGLLAMPCASRAQAPQDPWGALNSLRAGQKIEVIEKTLKKHVGTFMTVSAEAIQLREGAADDAIRREDVLRVSLPEKRHRLRNMLIFSVAGCGAGFGIGAASAGRDTLQYDVNTLFGGVIGFVGGIGVGAALPTHATIYRAKPH